MEPVQRYLNSLFFMTTKQWEKTQTAMRLKALQEGRPGLGRDYRLLVAARGSLESRFFEQVEQLMFHDRNSYFMMATHVS